MFDSGQLIMTAEHVKNLRCSSRFSCTVWTLFLIESYFCFEVAFSTQMPLGGGSNENKIFLCVDIFLESAFAVF